MMCKYLFISGRQSRLNSFLDGMGSLNLWGGNFLYDKFSSPDKADFKAVKSDWAMVGVDMNNSIKKFTNTHSVKLNGTKR